MLPTWNSTHEVSVSQVGDLWQAVSWFLRKRAANAVRWRCAEVLAGCRRQCEELRSYPAAVTAAITQSTNSLANPADRRRAHNKEVLSFFLPFWYEHILDRQRHDTADAAAEVARIMAAAPSLPPPPPPPAPLWFPAPLPSSATFFQPPPPPPTPSLFPPGTIQPGAQHSLPPNIFLGIPGSKSIVGNNIGFDPKPAQNLCHCLITARNPSLAHRGFECPLRYHARFSACPGWNSDGTRVASAWIGNDLTPATRADWKSFITKHNLLQPRAMGTDRVMF